MQAQRRSGSDPRLRAAATLLAGLLLLALITAARSAETHVHASRGSAVLTATTVDHGHGVQRLDHHGDLPLPPATPNNRVGRSATSDSSAAVSPHTAQTPPARGPPAEALA